MPLYLLTSYRKSFVIRPIVLCLIVNIAMPSLGSLPPPPSGNLTTPTITGVSGTCDAMVATWTDSGPNATYQLELMGPKIISVLVPATSYTFSDLAAGDYTLTAQAMVISGTEGDSGVSAAFPFTAVCPQACILPVVTVAAANPSPICRKEHSSVPVTFAGSVVSGCAISDIHYNLTDSHGGSSQGPVTLATDGSFMVAVPLSARHKGVVYALTVTATNSVGSATSTSLTVSVERCRHHRGDRHGDHDGDDDDNDHDHDD